MPERSSTGSKIIYWVAILAVIAIVLFLIGRWLFPELVQSIASVIVGCLALVTGLFLRKRRS